VDANGTDRHALDRLILPRDAAHCDAGSRLPYGGADVRNGAEARCWRLRGSHKHRYDETNERHTQAVYAGGLQCREQHEQRGRGDLLSRAEREHAAGHAYANPYNSRDGNGHVDRYARGNSDRDRYRYGDAYTYTDRDRYDSRDADCHGNYDSDRNRNVDGDDRWNGHADADGDSYAHGDTDFHANTYRDRDSFSHANQYPHSYCDSRHRRN